MICGHCTRRRASFRTTKTPVIRFFCVNCLWALDPNVEMPVVALPEAKE